MKNRERSCRITSGLLYCIQLYFKVIEDPVISGISVR